jgi:hypothetical protein
MIEYMTLADIRGEAGRFIGDTSSSRNTKLDETINEEYAIIARRWRWQSLYLAEEQSITAASGEKFLYLPKYVDRVYFLYEGTGQSRVPVEMIENFFDRRGFFHDTAGVIIAYADGGEVGRKVDFSTTAEQLQVVSDDAADTSQTVVVKGLLASDQEFKEELTLSGTSAVQTTKSYTELFSVSTDGTQAGVLTLSGSTSSTAYAVLTPTERTARYRRLRLNFVPPSATTITLYGKKKVNRLSFENDVVEVPIGPILKQYAISAHFAQQRQHGAAQYHRSVAERMLQDMTSDLDQEDRVEQGLAAPVLGRGLRRGRRGIIVNNG